MGTDKNLSEFVQQHSQTLRKKWLELVLSTYHEDTVRFLKKTDDSFSNPVGYAINDMVDEVIGCLQDGVDWQKLRSFVFPVVQIRAVQDFKPSEAISFVYDLKKVLKEQMSGQNEVGGDLYLELDEVMDEMTRICFDAFVMCREKLYEIRQTEFRSNLHMALRKSGMAEFE